ncbi:SIMPL domain-containing protein [Candidatus Peregrinibacteria bacterium]|nr:SIMPL domain-containing protein [Candidatus Peregrinibacteria bacterium]
MSDSQTITLRPPVWALLLAVVLGGLFYISGKKIEMRDRTVPTIVVSGEGKAFSVPDIAQASFGVQTDTMASAKIAMDSLQKRMNAVLDATKNAGIAEKDIQTQQFSLSPSYDWNNGTQTLKGYQASETFVVKIRNLDAVGDVLTAATNAGANQAGNVEFTLDNPEATAAKAREDAIAQAKTKAQHLASDLGMHLGRVRAFSEGQAPTPVPLRMMAMDAGVAAEKSLPVPAGEQEVQSQVTITYELE